MKFSTPWPPSVNHYWLLVSRGGRPRKVIGKKGLRFRKDIKKLIGEVTPMTGRLAIIIEAYPPDRRKRDLDNILKALLDALEHADVYLDDNQIDYIQLTRREATKPGRLDITLRGM